MKYLAVLLFAFFSSLNAYATQINLPNLFVNTNKISHVYGPIEDASAMQFMVETMNTAPLPGLRLILIDSPGGSVPAGQQMIDIMEIEKKAGVKQVCVVTGMAASMAFNLLTHCDVRVAVPKARLLAHKIAIVLPPFFRITVPNMQRLIKDLDPIDAVFDRENAAALHMSQYEYEKLAEEERFFTVQELVNCGYLHNIVNLK